MSPLSRLLEPLIAISVGIISGYYIFSKPLQDSVRQLNTPAAEGLDGAAAKTAPSERAPAPPADTLR